MYTYVLIFHLSDDNISTKSKPFAFKTHSCMFSSPNKGLDKLLFA